jgi:hypothetical protein
MTNMLARQRTGLFARLCRPDQRADSLIEDGRWCAGARPFRRVHEEVIERLAKEG